MKRQLVQYARSLGFERIGITSVEPLQREGEFLKRWLAEGRAGEMDYLERAPERRSRPAELLPGAKSVIALAMNYFQADRVGVSEYRRIGATTDKQDANTPSRRNADTHNSEGLIARYARGRDYHKVIAKRLESFVRYLEALAPGSQCRTFVDTGPLLERALAQRAGLGFIGKNTMLITKGLGSWVFLANVVTTLELPQDSPDERSCGDCRLCIDACPTQAIMAPYELDARRCIAYLTIESEKALLEDLRLCMGGWMFGCDICQEVCPHNTPSVLNRHSPRPLAGNPSSLVTDMMGPRQGRSGVTFNRLRLSEILSIHNDQQFHEQFEGTALMRAGREGLLRNACIAAANLGRADLTGRLQKLARSDSSPLVREHAAWALETLSAGRFSRVR